MRSPESYPLGKLPADHLRRLLTRYAPTDPAVVVGPTVGEDAAVLALSPDRYLVAKSDPVTFATEEIGWYAVHVNANDVACSGARPRWWMATVLLPEGKASADLVDTIFAQMADACAQVGAQLVGGHTEITYGLDRPVVVGTMLAELPPRELVTTAGARPDDLLILTKGIAVEGTAIIAREKGEELSDRLGSEFLERCVGFLHRPGISVVRDAQIATAAAPGGVHAMHDPTEGGVSTSLVELAAASGCGVELDGRSLPIYAETQSLCELFGLDPLGLIASGSLLIAAAPEAAEGIAQALRAESIAANVVGKVLPPGAGLWITYGDDRLPLPTFSRDELARLFEERD